VKNPYSNACTYLASLSSRADKLAKELREVSISFASSQRDDLFEKACAVADFLRRSDAAQTPCLKELIELCDQIRGR
jgi:hypothetical protein